MSSVRVVTKIVLLAILASPILATVSMPVKTLEENTLPRVAIHVSDYTREHWFYTTWKYFHIHTLLEEALRSDGTPFEEISDTDIETGRLLTSSGLPRYPILFSLAAECISSSMSLGIKEYVEAGGFVYVGSSSWTRNMDGSPHKERTKYTFWLSEEMGLDCLPTYHNASRPELGGQDWWSSWSLVGTADRAVLVRSTVSHRLVDHVPKGLRLLWVLPQTYDRCPRIDTSHYAWATTSTGATVLATFKWTGAVPATSEGYRDIPLMAYNQYGKGYFIYHSELAPLAGWGGFSVDSFEYAFFRRAIEWAFEENKVPLVRLGPWQYPNKAAFVIRHDADEGIAPMPSYVALEKSRGVRGEYYVLTELNARVSAPNLILQQARSDGAYIGSHSTYHIGPDNESEANASKNIMDSLDQLQNWLGGKPEDRPKIWVSPMHDAIREQSFRVIQGLGLISAGEQGVGPFPHLALSMETAGMHYDFVEMPTLEFFSTDAPCTPILATLSFYTDCSDPNGTMSRAIDFVYDMGGLINIYSHFRSGELARLAFYIEYTQTKSNVWFTNAEEIYDWWTRRDAVNVTPTFVHGSLDRIVINVEPREHRGPSDPGPFTLDVVLPWTHGEVIVNVNGAPTSDYKISRGRLRVPCGSPSQIEIFIAPPLTPQPTHTLNISSSPVSGLSFTIDGERKQYSFHITPYSDTLDEGTYKIVMPSTVTVARTTFNFVNWEDASNDPTRTISLERNMTLTAYYEESVPVKGVPKFGFILIISLIIVTSLVTIIYLLIKRKTAQTIKAFRFRA